MHSIKLSLYLLQLFEECHHHSCSSHYQHNDHHPNTAHHHHHHQPHYYYRHHHHHHHQHSFFILLLIAREDFCTIPWGEEEILLIGGYDDIGMKKRQLLQIRSPSSPSH